MIDIENTIKKIQGALTPDLLKKPYRERNETNPMFGHCYVATEALYHILKEDYPNRFSIFHGKDDEGITHWWLHDNEKVKIIDATSDQYYSAGKTPPYEKSRRGAFLTKLPSKRAVILMDRLGDVHEQKN
jgi:hypothetical protein